MFTKEKKLTVYDSNSELYNEYLEIYYDQYVGISDVKKRKFGHKYDPKELFLDEYDYSVRTEKSSDEEESTDKKESTDKEEYVDLSDMPPLEVDEEEVKKEKD